jgi:two-component system, cell cycle sensor histidine kinase and response regulator CckA
MKRDLRILHLEDSPEDAALVRRELRRAGMSCSLRCVDRREAFVEQLEKFQPDLVISDYQLSSFDGLQALALLRERFPELPCIITSGYVGEEYAAELLRSGATDFLLKTSLAARLVPTVRRAMRDVTERAARKRTEAMLQQAQKLEAVGQLTGGLAHDFNNLLGIVIANLDLLKEEIGGNPNARELAEQALEASLRGAELTRQLLAFSRQQPLQPKTIGLNDIVATTTDLLRRTLGEAIEIRLKLADDICPAMADPAQVESALVNLAVNARDAMPAGGVLVLETANKHLDEQYAAENAEVSAGDFVMMAVTDTGTGMPPEIVDRVFEPFFTTKETGKGTGLGLSMVYGFAKQSGGHVKIYSEVGHGTTIRLYLPRAQECAAVVEERPAEAPETTKISANILVVEDSPGIRKVVVRQLRGLGHHVQEAEGAAAALTVLQGEEPLDLLFTDVVMPGGMTGRDLADEARKLRPGIKVLLTSGFSEGAAQSDYGVELLGKPYRLQELDQKIRHAFGPA